MTRVLIDERAWAAAGAPQRKKLQRLAPALAADPLHGARIQRDRVPAGFVGRGALFRLALPEGWRALYTVNAREGSEPLVRVVWVGDHGAYDRLFGYH